TETSNLETTTDPGISASQLTLNSSTSNARGIGTNNPLDQGASTCSIVADGETIDCTTDFQGDARGGSWDAGADQFASTTPVCGNGILESGETCDDGNTTTETACPYGTPTCTLCNATCSATLSLTGPYCGDGSVTNGEQCDGSNLNGAS